MSVVAMVGCGDGPDPMLVPVLLALPPAAVACPVGVAAAGAGIAWWVGVEDVVEPTWGCCCAAGAVGDPVVLVGCAPTDSVAATVASGAGVGALLVDGELRAGVVAVSPVGVGAVSEAGWALPSAPVVAVGLAGVGLELAVALGVVAPVVSEPEVVPEVPDEAAGSLLALDVVASLEELPALVPEESVALVEEVPVVPPVVSVDDVAVVPLVVSVDDVAVVPPVVSVDDVPVVPLVVSVDDVAVVPPVVSVDELLVLDCEVVVVPLALLVWARAVAASQHIAAASSASTASVLAKCTPRGPRSATGP